MSKRYFKGLKADCTETLDHHTDDFTVARHIVQANKLRSDLKNFSTSSSMFPLVAKDGRSIGETQRQRRAREPHGDRPGDLRRGIRTEEQRPSRRTVDELITVLDQFRLKPRSQDVEILERGKNDLVVAPTVDLSELLLFKAADLLRGVRKNRRHAHGDERALAGQQNLSRRRAGLRRSGDHG